MEFALVELMIAKYDEKAAVEIFLVAIEHVHNRYHLPAMVLITEKGGEYEIASMKQDQFGIISLEFAAQGPKPRQAAPLSPFDAANAIDVVDRQKSQPAFSLPTGFHWP